MFNKFKNLIEENKFYEAHELIEEVWFKDRYINSYRIKILKGIINAAVSFELFKKNKVKQSNQVWLNYLKYRQLIFKSESEKNELYQLIRFIDNFNRNLKN